MKRLVALVSAASIVLAACGGAGAPAPAVPSATAQPVAKLKASYSNVIGDQLPIWIAKEGGYFAKNGLDVDLVNIASAQGIPALLAGEVVVAQLGGSEVLSAAVGGADIVVVAMLTGVYPFVFEVAADIKSVADLKGKKVGVSSIGSSSDIATRVALRRVGLDPDKDVTIVAVGSVQQRTAALLSGAIQAGVAQPPDTLIVEEKGYHVLFNLAELNLPAANTSVAVKKSYLAANRDVVQRYVDALIQAVAREKKDKAFSVQVAKQYFKTQSDRDMEALYDFYAVKVTQSLPEVRPEQFADSVSILAVSNEKVKSYDLKQLIDNSLVADAAKRGVDKQ